MALRNKNLKINSELVNVKNLNNYLNKNDGYRTVTDINKKIVPYVNLKLIVRKFNFKNVFTVDFATTSKFNNYLPNIYSYIFNKKIVILKLSSKPNYYVYAVGVRGLPYKNDYSKVKIYFYDPLNSKKHFVTIFEHIEKIIVIE